MFMPVSKIVIDSIKSRSNRLSSKTEKNIKSIIFLLNFS